MDRAPPVAGRFHARRSPDNLGQAGGLEKPVWGLVGRGRFGFRRFGTQLTAQGGVDVDHAIQGLLEEKAGPRRERLSVGHGVDFGGSGRVRLRSRSRRSCWASPPFPAATGVAGETRALTPPGSLGLLIPLPVDQVVGNAGRLFVQPNPDVFVGRPAVIFDVGVKGAQVDEESAAQGAQRKEKGGEDGEHDRVQLRTDEERLDARDARAQVQQNELNGAEQADGDAEDAGEGDRQDELAVIPLSDALIEPLAVMVKAFHTFVAEAAVFGPVRAEDDGAPLAPNRFLADPLNTKVLTVPQRGRQHGTEQDGEQES